MILVIYFIEALGISLMAFLLAWWIVGRNRSGRLRLDMRDQISGWLLTALFTALVRVAVVAILGGEAMRQLWTNRGVGLIGGFALPLIAAILISTRMRKRAGGATGGSNAPTLESGSAG